MKPPKLTDAMLRVLREIKGSQWGMCGSLGTRLALVRRGLIRKICDEQGRIHYEISPAGTSLLEEA